MRVISAKALDVQGRIAERAKLVGSKASNLMELNELCLAIGKKLNFKVQVPEINPLTHEVIFNHLSHFAPQWQERWGAFKKIQSNIKEDLSKEALKELESLQSIIIETFEKFPLEDKILEQYLKDLPKDSLLMVRSTGKEDTLDLVNPGGNESVAAVKPDKHSISKAIGVVVASYLKEKSLRQRLIAKQDITEDPFMPVLIQRIVGEPFVKVESPESIKSSELSNQAVQEIKVTLDNKEANNIGISGVIYTEPTKTRIDLAPGHGELIVNSKAPFDTFFITDQNTVHALIYGKVLRLAPIETTEGGKAVRKLVFQRNPKNIQEKSAISPEIALKIKLIGKELENHYDIPLDIEFVYDPKSEILYLVQARPLKKPLDNPSAIAPDKFPTLKATCPMISIQSVATPEINSAKVLTKPSEAIICHDIAIALEIYLKDLRKSEAIKAVIIQEPAPATSHAAAQFKEMGIVVIQVADISQVDAWLKRGNELQPRNEEKQGYEKKSINENNNEEKSKGEAKETKEAYLGPVVIVDSQRKRLVNAAELIKDLTKDLNNDFPLHPEAVLYNKDILKFGLFKSNLPAFNSLLPLIQKNTDFKPIARIPMHDTLLGDLIQKANSPNKKERDESLNLLLQKLYQLLPQGSPQSKHLLPTLIINQPSKQDKISQITGPGLYSYFMSQIEMIEAARAGEDNKKAFEALANILGKLVNLTKTSVWLQNKEANNLLFQHVIIQAAEIYQALREFSNTVPKVSTKTTSKVSTVTTATTVSNDNDTILAQKQWSLLDSAARLEALISDPGGRHLYSYSIKQLAQRHKEYLAVKKVPGFEDLSEEGKSYFIELFKVNKLALNPAIKEAWIKFALNCCKNPKNTQKINHLINFNLHNGIESDWLNNYFAECWKKVNSQKNEEYYNAAKNDPKKLQNLDRLETNAILEMLYSRSLSAADELNNIKLSEKRFILESFERRINEWANPNDFEKLWSEYQRDFLPLIETLDINDDMSSLAKKTVLKLVQSMTEIMDRTIKSLKGSMHYSNTERRLKAQRFAMLLKGYHHLMQKWVSKIPDWQFKEWSKYQDLGSRKEDILKEIEETFQRASFDPDERQLNSSGQLSVEAAKIGSTAAFDRQFTWSKGRFTLEDLFSLMHQNILASTIYLDSDNKLLLNNLPSRLQSFAKAVNAVSNIDGTRKTFTDFVGIEHVYPIITLSYNLPLRNHSAKFLLHYDQVTETIRLGVKFFGHNAGGRMDLIALLADFQARVNGMKILGTSYNESTMALEYTLEFNKDMEKQSLETLTGNLEEFAILTFLRDITENIQIQIKIVNYNLPNYESKIEFLQKLSKTQNKTELTKYLHIILVIIVEIVRDPKAIPSEDKKHLAQLLPMEYLFDNAKILSISDLELLSKKFDYPIDFNYKKSNTTLFEKFLHVHGNNILELITKFGITPDNFPTLKKLALHYNSGALFKYCITFNAKFDAIDIDFIFKLLEYNSIEIYKIYVDSFLQKIDSSKFRLLDNLIVDIVQSLPDGDLKYKQESMTILINALLDKGTPLNALDPRVLSVMHQFPSVWKRYMDHLEINKIQYDIKSKLDFASKFENIDIIKSLLLVGFPADKLKLDQIKEISKDVNPNLKLICLEYLLDNAKIKPADKQVVNQVDKHEAQVFDQLIYELVLASDKDKLYLSKELMEYWDQNKLWDFAERMDLNFFWKVRQLYQIKINFNYKPDAAKYTLLEKILRTHPPKDVIKLIQDERIDLNLHKNALYCAFKSGNYEIAQTLISQNKLNFDQIMNPNMLLTIFQNRDMQKLLNELLMGVPQEKFKNLNKYIEELIKEKEKKGLNNLSLAAAINFCLDKGVNFDAQNPKVLNFVFGDKSLTERYLKHFRDNSNQYPLKKLAEDPSITQQPEMIKLLLKLDIPIKGDNIDQYVALWNACDVDKSLQRRILQQLIDNTVAGKGVSLQDMIDNATNIKTLSISIYTLEGFYIVPNINAMSLRSYIHAPGMRESLYLCIKRNMSQYSKEIQEKLCVRLLGSTLTDLYPAVWPEVLNVISFEDFVDFFKTIKDFIFSSLDTKTSDELSDFLSKAIVNDDFEKLFTEMGDSDIAKTLIFEAYKRAYLFDPVGTTNRLRNFIVKNYKYNWLLDYIFKESREKIENKENRENKNYIETKDKIINILSIEAWRILLSDDFTINKILESQNFIYNDANLNALAKVQFAHIQKLLEHTPDVINRVWPPIVLACHDVNHEKILLNDPHYKLPAAEIIDKMEKSTGVNYSYKIFLLLKKHDYNPLIYLMQRNEFELALAMLKCPESPIPKNLNDIQLLKQMVVQSQNTRLKEMLLPTLMQASSLVVDSKDAAAHEIGKDLIFSNTEDHKIKLEQDKGKGMDQGENPSPAESPKKKTRVKSELYNILYI